MHKFTRIPLGYYKLNTIEVKDRLSSLWSETNYSMRPPQLVVAKNHNIWIFTKTLNSGHLCNAANFLEWILFSFRHTDHREYMLTCK